MFFIDAPESEAEKAARELEEKRPLSFSEFLSRQRERQSNTSRKCTSQAGDLQRLDLQTIPPELRGIWELLKRAAER